MRLSKVNTGKEVFIRKVRGIGAFRKRIMEMGFVAGKKVKVVKNAPLNDPIEFQVMGYSVSLRRAEAELISVVETADKDNYRDFKAMYKHEEKKGEPAAEKCSKIHVALVGNPNCGKTTIFNFLAGVREKVGNYSGVTVDSKEAEFKYNGYTIKLIDLPGTYSLTAYTPEEIYVRRYLFEQQPDIVLNVLDGSNLERNLYLTTQLIDMDLRVAVALNMYDEMESRNDRFDFHSLSQLLGMPIVPTVGSKKKGLNNLCDKLIEIFEDRARDRRHIHIQYGEELEEAVKNIRKELHKGNDSELSSRISPRFLSLKLLENDEEITDLLISKCANADNIIKVAKKEQDKIKKIYSETCEALITDSKYGFVAGALKETFIPGQEKKAETSKLIDTFVTHKFWGYPLFLLFMWVTFKATFSIGEYPMGWLESLVEFLASSTGNMMSEGPLKDLIIDGVIGGVGGVIVFLPNILILFFFISFMEDTGYMSRAVFIMDKLMHKMGLHGRSFIPMLMGFGCSVPAIMATRTIDSKKNRMITMLVTPFMSCGARLPVYILLIAAFFPGKETMMLSLIYLLGVLVAIASSILFKKTLFKGDDTPFVMELPPYRMPTLRSTIIHMWDKGSQYLKKMGGVILVGSVVIWSLSYFPRGFEKDSLYQQEMQKLRTQNAELEKKTEALELHTHLRQSYLGKIGHLTEPVLKPLGFDWKVGIALVSGVVAKEVVVSTLGVLYQSEDEARLSARIHKEDVFQGEKGPLVALVLMIFVLLYVPCLATVAAIKKESNSWRWAIFSAVYSTGVAWIFSFIVYQVGSLFL